ncbi:MAG: carboxypeptidase-like regulatory domain-containing protein [Maribacter sp.]|nr:carboxypeptidase-like regulatory domain-containing protein [Maribacter sp.]MBT8313465.1 carboxypeptidase-like regulatory domain-containing protein [Maribacter sp.]
MKKMIFILFLTLNTVFSQERSKVISGIVSDGHSPMENVQITVDELDTTLFSDAQGRYTLKALPGNTIRYSFTGKKTVEIVVEDVTRILNVEMIPDLEELDEVVVTKSKRRSQQELELEYNSNPNLIKTAYGIIDPETAAYQIRILSEEYISSVNLCILDVLRNEFPGLTVRGDCLTGGIDAGRVTQSSNLTGRKGEEGDVSKTDTRVTVRGSNSLFNDQSVIFDVDGQIMTDAPIWILPSNMKRVAVLSSFAASTKYGAIASGGVVIINTNSGSTNPKSKEIADQARLRNNKYMGDALSLNSLSSDLPIYLQEFQESSSLEEFKKKHAFYAPRYGSSYGYYVDALQYVNEHWKGDRFEADILQDGLARFKENPIALKAMAYVYQANGDFQKANELYKEIFIQRPNYGQSYMDLANSYREMGDSKKAASLYMRYDYLLNKGFLANDSTAFAKLMDRELNNLVAVSGRDILSKQDFKKALLKEYFSGTRLVFEWNDSEAEFELQFVNPEGHYYKKTHSLAVNSERIREEKLIGYACDEFLIDESLSGTWQVNAKYLGNKSLTPSYLKATIYYDYGSLAQRKETKVFKLGLKNVNLELFKVRNSSKKAAD